MRSTETIELWPKDSLETWMARAQNRGPFGFGETVIRSSTSILQASETEDNAGQIVQTALRREPSLGLQGTIGKAQKWEAVISGVPGRADGLLVRVGDTLAGMRIEYIDSIMVTIMARDSLLYLYLAPEEGR